MWNNFKNSKYRAQRVSFKGRSFASKLEASLYAHLLDLESQGLIFNIKCQVQVKLTDAEIIYKPDFCFFNNETEKTEYAEAKGFETSDWRIKRRLWMHYGPGKLYIYKGNAKKITLNEVLEPKVK